MTVVEKIGVLDRLKKLVLKSSPGSQIAPSQIQIAPLAVTRGSILTFLEAHRRRRYSLILARPHRGRADENTARAQRLVGRGRVYPSDGRFMNIKEGAYR